MLTVTPRSAQLMIDPRPAFAAASAIAGATITSIRPDQLAEPTPCGSFDVRQLLGHLLAVLDRVAVVGRGTENPFARPETLAPPDGDWARAWQLLSQQVDAAWADPAALERPTMLPWAARSGALALGAFVAELSVHTWDLARATGQHPTWDDEALALSLHVMRDILPAAARRERFEAMRATMAEELRAGPDPYGPAVPVAADAPLIDQLVAHLGRRPA